MKTAEYWAQRFINLEKVRHNRNIDTYEIIDSALRILERDLQEKISTWYMRFAKNNELNIVDARKLLTSDELEELKWNVNEYIKYGKENAINGQWIKQLENASAKFHVSRLEELQLNIRNAFEKAFTAEEQEVTKLLTDVYNNDYYKSIFEIEKGLNTGWNVAQVDERRLHKLLSQPWTTDDKTFSDRIWQRKSQLNNQLQERLIRILAIGESPDKSIEALTGHVKGTVKNARNAAARLIMTESAFIGSEAQKDAFNDLDIEEFEIVATLDSHTSETCRTMDGKHFPMKDFKVGINAPPFHPNCRTVTAPYFDDDFSIGERAARNKEGATYYVPSDITYKEWAKDNPWIDTDKEKSINTNYNKEQWI